MSKLAGAYHPSRNEMFSDGSSSEVDTTYFYEQHCDTYIYFPERPISIKNHQLSSDDNLALNEVFLHNLDVVFKESWGGL